MRSFVGSGLDGGVAGSLGDVAGSAFGVVAAGAVDEVAGSVLRDGVGVAFSGLGETMGVRA